MTIRVLKDGLLIALGILFAVFSILVIGIASSATAGYLGFALNKPLTGLVFGFIIPSLIVLFTLCLVVYRRKNAWNGAVAGSFFAVVYLFLHFLVGLIALAIIG